MAQYHLSTAKAVCNDQQRDTWEVQALASDGCWWTVSDSSQLSQDEAESQARDMREADSIA